MWFRNIFNVKPRRSDPAAAAPRRQAPASLLTPRVLRMLNHLALDTGPVRPRQASGARSGFARHPASEFREHRAYSPGDDVRYVDWKASARQEHIFIKQSADPKAELVYLLLDCSASMAWGSPPKSETSLALANLVGYLALSHQDRLVVLPAAESSSRHALGPLWGKGQAPLLNRYLQSLAFGGQVDVTRALAGLSRHKLSQGGLVVVISDLLGTERLDQALAALPAPAWKVSILHLMHPEELEPPIRGHFEMVDIETGQKKQHPVTQRVVEQYRQRLGAWRESAERTCQKNHAAYAMLTAHTSIAVDILPALQRARVVKTL
jgi:uncharacterized protein (DUF58 family)